MHTKFELKNLKKRDHFGDISAKWMIVLKLKYIDMDQDRIQWPASMKTELDLQVP
jgi:hypothetical protein